MNHSAILRRAFDIARHHRSLWIFGFLVALTSGGGGNGVNFSDFGQPGDPGTAPDGAFDPDTLRNLPEGVRRFVEALQSEVRSFDPNRLIGLALAAICAGLLVLLVFVVLHYVSRVALIRMVDEIERTGVAPAWRAGFRLGWSRASFRLFVLELVLGLGVLFLLSALVGIPLLLLFTVVPEASQAAVGIGGVLLFVCCAVPFLIAFSIAFSIVQELWSRELALADRGIGEALSGSLALARGRWADVGLMWLALVLLGIAFLFVLIPVALVSFAIAAAAGLGVGYAIWEMASSALGATVAGGFVGFVLLAIPVAFVNGLWEVFRSSAWTLSWRVVTLPPVDPAPPALVTPEAPA